MVLIIVWKEIGNGISSNRVVVDSDLSKARIRYNKVRNLEIEDGTEEVRLLSEDIKRGTKISKSVRGCITDIGRGAKIKKCLKYKK